jgi:hypothetical protein
MGRATTRPLRGTGVRKVTTQSGGDHAALWDCRLRPATTTAVAPHGAASERPCRMPEAAQVNTAGRSQARTDRPAPGRTDGCLLAGALLTLKRQSSVLCRIGWRMVVAPCEDLPLMTNHLLQQLYCRTLTEPDLLRDRLMMNNSWFQNIASEFLALGILLVLGWFVYQLKSRGPRLSFFGIKKTKKLFVYLSHLRIQSGGALGIDDKPRSFGESAIPAYEAELMPALQRLFNYVVPGVEDLPGYLNRLLLSDVDVEVLPLSARRSRDRGRFDLHRSRLTWLQPRVKLCGGLAALHWPVHQ